MTDRGNLTPIQRKCLVILRERGPTRFSGQTRDFEVGDCEGGSAIRAYMDPELFLARRGLIEEHPSNYPGRWFRLTEEGAQRASRINASKLFSSATLQRWHEAAL